MPFYDDAISILLPKYMEKAGELDKWEKDNRFNIQYVFQAMNDNMFYELAPKVFIQFHTHLTLQFSSSTTVERPDIKCISSRQH